MAFFIWQGNTELNLSPASYISSSPDIGAFENGLAVGIEDKSFISVEFGLYKITQIHSIQPQQCDFKQVYQLP